MDPDDARLDARFRALEEEISSLRKEVTELRSGRGRTMRHDTACPGCGCRKILHAREVLDRSDGGRQKLALTQPSIWSSSGAGEFEAYVCTSCGIVEWYVLDLLSLKVDGQSIRLIDGEPRPGTPDGPYR